MKNRALGIWMAMVAWMSWGCGGTTPGGEPENALGEEQQALVSCSTSCPSGQSLSCWGSTCSAADASYVQCDGVYQYCQPTQPPLDCSLSSESCVSLLGTACSPRGAQRKCCMEGLPTGNCTCTFSNQWTCTIPPEAP